MSITARAKGLREFQAAAAYPVRVALNPFISTIGWVLPQPGLGRHHHRHRAEPAHRRAACCCSALFSQDMYLAGAFILLLSVLTLIGTLVSDLLLAWLDPRIRFT